MGRPRHRLRSRRGATAAGLALALAGLFLLPGLPSAEGVSPSSSAGSGGAPPLPAALISLERQMGLTSVGPLPRPASAPSRPAATTLYVSNLGSLSGTCTLAAPCRQISQAMALLGPLTPGETILVTNGTFLGFDATGLNGTRAAPVLIESTGGGSVLVPTVNRSDNRDTVHFLYSGNITLDGFQSYDANRAAVRIDQSDNITVENCTFGDSAEWGIFTDFDHNSTLVHNTIYGTVGQHGIYVSNSPIAPVVRWNLLYDNHDAGLQINADATQGGWGEQSGGDIEDNVIYDNGAGGAAGINLDGNINTRVVNNLLYDNHATGIVNYANDGLFGPRGMTVMDNTVVMASNGRWALQFEDSTGENFVRDNILDNLNPAHGGLEFGTQDDVNDTDSDYNVLGSVTLDSSGNIYTLAQWQALGYEPHSISATPAQLFVDYTAGNYNLSATSPAIKAGEYLPNVTTDLVGNPRPVGLPSDIGCYQYVSPTPEATAQATPTSGAVPLTVDFTGGATGGTSPYTFQWSYGDGSPPSYAQDPIHVYNSTGMFAVELTVTDAALAVAHAFLNVTVTAVPPPPLIATAEASPLSGTAPLTVAFNGSASGGVPAYSFVWSFGDGSPVQTVRNPTHTFELAGNFTATLWVNDAARRNATSSLNITVSGLVAPPPPLTAHITGPTAVQEGVAATYTVDASGGSGGNLYEWNFGNGTGWTAPSSSSVASHSFEELPPVSGPSATVRPALVYSHTFPVRAWVNDTYGDSFETGPWNVTLTATLGTSPVVNSTTNGTTSHGGGSLFSNTLFILALAGAAAAVLVLVVVVVSGRGKRRGSRDSGDLSTMTPPPSGAPAPDIPGSEL